MVKIDLPPPTRQVDPIFYELPSQTLLLRIFDPTRHNTLALTFRSFGPIHRFDHHRGPKKGEDPEHSVYYCAFTLSSCLVETFGDTGIVELKAQRLAFVRTCRALQLLDLRGPGAMRAGSVAALAKVAERTVSQAWSRHFHQVYTDVGGVLYLNAHNDEESIVLYERAADALTLEHETSLDDAGLRPHILNAALTNNLTVFYS